MCLLLLGDFNIHLEDFYLKIYLSLFQSSKTRKQKVFVWVLIHILYPQYLEARNPYISSSRLYRDQRPWPSLSLPSDHPPPPPLHSNSPKLYLLISRYKIWIFEKVSKKYQKSIKKYNFTFFPESIKPNFPIKTNSVDCMDCMRCVKA